MIPILAQSLPTDITPYVAGPGSAVVVLMTVLGGLYKLTTMYLMPLANRALDSHLSRIDALISVQREESKQVTKTLSSIDRRLARLEGITDGQGFSPTLSPDRLT